MTDLEIWLAEATRGLAAESAAEVRAEIQQHYESACEAAIARGATPAEQIAITALGDPNAANREYRRVMLTRAEARLLHQGNEEARLFCRRWASWTIAAISAVALISSLALYAAGSVPFARIALACGVGSGLMTLAKHLPIYTPQRSRLFRPVKWVLHVGLLLLAFGPGALRMQWLLVLCFWQFVITEMRRNAIRRKLPVAQWPRQLYL